MPRWARGKKDSNHDELVRLLKATGWLVKATYQLRGFCDAVAWKPGCGVHLIEFKRARTAKLTKAQQTLAAEGWPIRRLNDAADVAQLASETRRGEG